MRRGRVVLALLAVVVSSATTIVGSGAGDAAAIGALDCTNWRYGPADEPPSGSLPSELDRNSYKTASARDPNPELFDSPHEQCGQKGPALDLALGITQGRDDVLIAVLDSGIKWHDAGAMHDLATKAFVNLGEARPPCGAPFGDCNGDGGFDIADFGALTDRNANGVSDPEDLILDPAVANGVDDDANGYVDDIAGWDFLYGDNNPLDVPEYGHGTGEALDSTAAANGTGDVGTCPRCRFLPVRVSDSFIGDGARFAAGVLFALDSGADVVQEALGAVSNPPQAQQAIDAAYERGVVVVASMADEAAKHPNLPSSLEHTMSVNSVTELESPFAAGVHGYLALNGCTNFGGRTFVSIPSGSCSSEATGRSAGMVGLVLSAARDRGLTLSANEVMQLVRATADDVDFATPNAHDPANDFDPGLDGLVPTMRYPTAAGWDATFGYGRINVYELLKAVRDSRIPPVADMTSPRWFDVFDTDGDLRVTGTVGAPRATSYDYRVEWTTGLQPPPYPATDTWHVAAEHTNLRAPRRGQLAMVRLADIAAALPEGGTGTPADPATNRPDEERYSVRVRVVVTAHDGPGDGLVAEHQKQVFVHDDPQLVAGYPIHVEGAGTASPVFAQLDRTPHEELVVATDDGRVEAFKKEGNRLRHFPVRTATPSWWPTGSRTAHDARIAPPGNAIGVGAPAVADIDADGTPEIVVSDFGGDVSVWEADGDVQEGAWPAHVDPTFSLDDPAVVDEHNRMKLGIVSSPAVGDLDADGQLEIVVAALDRHVYAWHADGRPVAGFPVLVVDPAKVTAVDPVTHHVSFAPTSRVTEGGELTATPTLADLTGDGRPEIVIGAQEAYEETPNIGPASPITALLDSAGDVGNARLYAISPDGTNASYADRNAAHPADQAYLPGWPVSLAMLQLEALPTIGDGVATQAIVADVAPAPGVEVIASAAVGPLYVLNAAGDSVFGAPAGRDAPLAWAAGLFNQDAARFGAMRNSNDIAASLVAFGGPAAGHLDDDASADISAPTAGLSRLFDVALPDLQLPNDDHLMAWRGDTGNALPGFPQTTTDLAFFVTPAIADVDGDGARETIAGNGTYLLQAHDADGPRRRAGRSSRVDGWSGRRASVTGTARAVPRSPLCVATARCSYGTPTHPRRHSSGHASAAAGATPASS